MNVPLIPYFQTSRYRVERMVELSYVKRNDRMCDLGSGDGRIVMAFAETGADAFGYELDSGLIMKSRKLITEKNNLATILEKDFWDENLSEYDVVTVYPMPDVMMQLQEKLKNELYDGSRVLVNYYPFSDWEYTSVRDNVYLYIK